MDNRAREMIFERFIAPLKKPRDNYIGIEIELPIVNLSGQKNNRDFCVASVEKAISRFGFSPTKIDDDGICFEAVCEDTGDVFSFDCSYNNFEISLGRVRTLHEAQARFRSYVGFINAELTKSRHILTGLGINPNYKINDYNFVASPRYKMLEGYLRRAQAWGAEGSFHPFFAFGTFSSASQVQLDVSNDRLCEVIRAFSLAEPLKAVLFANSYLPEMPELLCVRDYLWEHSTHGINRHNVGFFEPLVQTTGEIVDYLCGAGVFCTEREGKFVFFRPIPFEKYIETRIVEGEYYDGKFHTISFEPREDDISYLRTYKQIDLTARGTLEFRSACTQPLSQAMTVAAFHLGLSGKITELTKLLETSFLYQNSESPAQLRQKMNRRDFLLHTDKDKLKALLKATLQLCREGLTERGFAEENYLEPLFQRAEALTSPSVYFLQNQDQKEKVIREFAELSK